MRYIVVRPDDEVDELLNQCADSENDGESEFPGMTYEQGIRSAIEWLTDEDNEYPLDD